MTVGKPRRSLFSFGHSELLPGVGKLWKAQSQRRKERQGPGQGRRSRLEAAPRAARRTRRTGLPHRLEQFSSREAMVEPCDRGARRRGHRDRFHVLLHVMAATEILSCRRIKAAPDLAPVARVGFRLQHLADKRRCWEYLAQAGYGEIMQSRRGLAWLTSLSWSASAAGLSTRPAQLALRA